VKVLLQAAVVWVLRSAWERVTEREELVGRLSFVSRLPQYLFENKLDRGCSILGFQGEGMGRGRFSGGRMELSREMEG